MPLFWEKKEKSQKEEKQGGKAKQLFPPPLSVSLQFVPVLGRFSVTVCSWAILFTV